MMPTEFPPPEIIETLEEQLGMDFIHFTVSLEGVVEGIFGDGLEQQVVSFEAKREKATNFAMPPIESLIGELDEKAVEDMHKMFQSILAEIETVMDKDVLEFIPDNIPPTFDGDWYCP
jgi:hypothetical protein